MVNLCVKGRHDRFYETREPVGLKVRRQKILTDLSSKSVRNFWSSGNQDGVDRKSLCNVRKQKIKKQILLSYTKMN